jgi:two-component system NtrC family sensor kinase
MGLTSRVFRDAWWVEIRVADTGPGIPEKVRTCIFDPFITTKPVGRGTGQGLAIAHTIIVQKHHGAITFETTEGRGTTFIIRLPCAPATVDTDADTLREPVAAR